MRSMRVIDYSDLVQGDHKALKSLREAATVQGFFMLRLDGAEGANLRDDVAFLKRFTSNVLDSPASVREEFSSRRLGNLRISGFKEVGTVEGAAKGKLDGFEMYMLSQDEVLQSKQHHPQPLPPRVIENRKQLQRCFASYSELSIVLLQRVVETLSLDKGIVEAHSIDAPSATNMSFLRYPIQPDGSAHHGHIAHTDVGTMTILSTTERGLQVIDSDTQDWTFVDTPADALCIQFGDCFSFLSNGQVLSSLHRVVSSDRIADSAKLTVAYFVRPNLDALISPPGDLNTRYVDYHCKKFNVFLQSSVDRKDPVNDILSTRQVDGVVGSEE